MKQRLLEKSKKIEKKDKKRNYAEESLSGTEKEYEEYLKNKKNY